MAQVSNADPQKRLMELDFAFAMLVRTVNALKRKIVKSNSKTALGGLWATPHLSNRIVDITIAAQKVISTMKERLKMSCMNVSIIAVESDRRTTERLGQAHTRRVSMVMALGGRWTDDGRRLIDRSGRGLGGTLGE
ncbi:unnamed protein product, partial [Nippostrongylus brasiliensis]|uniref:Four helix bundle protein n=1 Tax=Nippostrongylus brasiliensis TaxID=27835 RepID=A0A0N4XZG2_NIPBR